MSIEVNKTDRIVNVTVEKKYGKSIEADIDIAGQRVGFKQEGEANFEYIDLPKLEFDDLTQAEKDSLKLTFDQLTQAEKDSLKGSDANVTSENIEEALNNSNQFNLLTKLRHDFDEDKQLETTRPVINDVNYYATPIETPTVYTTYHGEDVVHIIKGNKTNNLTNVACHEVNVRNLATTPIGFLLGYFALIENYSENTMDEAIGIRVGSRNHGAGDIGKSKTIFIQAPEINSTGGINDAYGIYIEDFNNADNDNYGVYSLADNFLDRVKIGSRIEVPKPLTGLEAANVNYVNFGVQNNVLRINYPGRKYLGSGNFTGAIKITLPVFFTSTFLKFSVTVHDYNEDNTFKIHISGYNNASSTEWKRTSVNTICSNENRDVAVRFGHDGTNACIWVGETSSNWYHGVVSIENFIGTGMNGVNDELVNMFSDNWGIDLVSSLDTVQVTKTNNLPYTDFNKLKNKPNGVSGSFTSSDGKTVTVTDGLITSII